MNRSGLLLRVLTGAALVGIAVVHLRITDRYREVGDHPFSIGDQFIAQAVLAFLLTIALLIRPHRLVWLACVGFAAGSLAVLVYSRYRSLPVVGLPNGFRESWSVEGAKLAASFEAAALLLSMIGAALTWRGRVGPAARVSARSAAG